jgi:hypothetical protein
MLVNTPEAIETRGAAQYNSPDSVSTKDLRDHIEARVKPPAVEEAATSEGSCCCLLC